MVERLKIVIPHRLPSLNEVIGANRSNKYAGAKMKKQTQALIQQYIKAQCKEKFEKIRIEIEWYEPNKKRDFDNIASAKKFILDALVKCDVIPNDGWKNVAPSFIDCFYLDKDNPRVEIYITDMM
jgi:uncharacterized protein involved in tellurium resistance